MSRALTYFKEISKIPRNSGDEKRISDYIVKFGKERGLEVYQDDLYNVLICKKASKGYEDIQPILLEAHMDMVCVKQVGSNHDFSKDPIELVVDKDEIRALDTTLGADDGFGVAYMLAILDSDVPHPSLECLFTVQEESGCFGIAGFDLSRLKARNIISLDGDREKGMIVSCYCSHRYTLRKAYHPIKVNKEGYELRVFDLSGGLPEGITHQECLCAMKIIVRMLMDLEGCYQIESFVGGTEENYLAIDATCTFYTALDERVVYQCFKRGFEAVFKELSDFKGKWSLKRKKVVEAMSEADSKTLVSLLYLLPNNLFQTDVAHQLISTINLGIVEVKEGSSEVIMMSRSKLASMEEQVEKHVGLLSKLYAYEMNTEVRYLSWKYREISPLRKLFNQVAEYQEEICPGGLEVAHMDQSMDDCDIVVIGPDIHKQHTSEEVMNLSSFERVYQVVVKVLEMSKGVKEWVR